ncbi:MAG: hypothetical protein J1E39_00095 [Eubacterium sp.]|nr:hypothetical protein [Eubacterium sp.]
MRHRNNRKNCIPAVILAGIGALICLTYLSAEVMLLVLAVLLIALGLWLLFCG